MRLKTVFGLIKKYGLLDLTKITAEIILGKISNRRINRMFYQSAVNAGLPYFGEYLGARQGVLRRHAYMFRLAQREFRQRSHMPYKILEVGSYAGASAITWSLALRNNGAEGVVYCVDPWDDYFAGSDQDAENKVILQEMAQALKAGQVRALFNHNVASMGLSNLVKPVVGFFREAAKDLQEDDFDFIYIDGNHVYNEVMADLNAAGKLVNTGGILCGDDLEEQWKDVDQEYCAANCGRDVVVDPKTGRNIHPGVTKAVADFFGSDVACYNGFWVMRKTETGWSPINDLGRYRSKDLPPHLRWWAIKTSSWFKNDSKSKKPIGILDIR